MKMYPPSEMTHPLSVCRYLPKLYIPAGYLMVILVFLKRFLQIFKTVNSLNRGTTSKKQIGSLIIHHFNPNSRVKYVKKRCPICVS